MKKTPPAYFYTIQTESSNRWDQLEKFPDLAAPWHQLFRQIQSPRHVISELLQNADDVGATNVDVRIENGIFSFEHNGLDFDEDNLRSLCRFGFSNKRKLHTIGFRGIGFKSTFSVGDRVEVYTPTLSFAFGKQRFTQPEWIEDDIGLKAGNTRVKVAIKDAEVENFLAENMTRWIDTPVSLLFFQSVRQISFNGQNVIRKDVKPGPLENSIWTSLVSNKVHNLLLVTSDEEEIHPDALQEIREERGDPDYVVPPTRVHLIYGLERQQLFEILPTNVLLDIPFSANGPFIQDPARTGIKDPLESALNRWLLVRIGALAARTILKWLENTDLSLDKRVDAYRLLPKKSLSLSNGTISSYCNSLITEKLIQHLNANPILLTTRGNLAKDDLACLNLPAVLCQVWDEAELIAYFGKNYTSILAAEIPSDIRALLQENGYLEKRSPHNILDRLTNEPAPPKTSLQGMQILWRFVCMCLDGWNGRFYKKSELRIVPTKRGSVLQASKTVNVLSNKEKQFTEDDLEFLLQYLYIIEEDFRSYISNIAKAREQSINNVDRSELQVYQLYKDLGLDTSSTNETIIRQAAGVVFSANEFRDSAIRLAQIASKIDIQIPETFKYLCKNGDWQVFSYGVLYPDQDGIATLLPEQTVKLHELSGGYEAGLSEIDRRRWRAWMQSGKSGMRRFLLPKKSGIIVSSKKRLQDIFQERNSICPTEFPLKSMEFSLYDFDFPQDLWAFWEKQAAREPQFWARLIYQIAMDWSNGWQGATSALALQNSSSRARSLNHSFLPSAWLHKFRALKCIPDTFRKLHYPSELVRSTSETSVFQGIETFVHPDFDRPEFTQFLDLLGVRSQATDYTKLIDRLRTLSKAPARDAIIRQTVSLYNALEQLIFRIDTPKLENIRLIFASENLILSTALTWENARTIYQSNPNRLPGVFSIHSLVSDLNLWDKVKVRKVPKIEDVFAWLQLLPKDTALPSADLERVRTLIQLYADRVWNECQCWLSAQQTWRSIDCFNWSTEQSVSQDAFFSWVTEKTADFSMLPAGSAVIALSSLPPLESRVEYRLSNYKISRHINNPEWIRALGDYLYLVKRSKLGRNGSGPRLDIANIRAHASILKETQLLLVRNLDVSPFINGEQAGYVSQVKALWQNTKLYVIDTRTSTYHEVVAALSAAFSDQEIRKTIEACAMRDKHFIDGYIGSYFDLESETDAPLSREHDLSDKTNQEPTIIEVTPIDEKPDSNIEEFELRKKRKTALKPEEKFGLFIQNFGFSWDTLSKQFLNPDGRRVIQLEGTFPWNELDGLGKPIGYYLLVEGALDTGIIVPTEVIDVMKRRHEMYWLVLHDDNQYRKIQWPEIEGLLASKQLLLAPSTYIIRTI